MKKRIAQQFARVYLRGLDPLRTTLDSRAVLAISNHTSYWDPMMAMLIGYRLLDAEGYAMMDAANLARLPFLGRMGGFGVDLSDPLDGTRAIAYTVGLLNKKNRLVWIFPQAQERPVTAPMDDFKPGAAIIARRARQAAVVPVGLSYVFGATAFPDAYISIGPPVAKAQGIKADVRAQQDAVSRQLRLISGHLDGTAPLNDFEVVSNRPEKKIARWTESMLARLTRY
ncbi:MAG: lysophospholipid acyltransferase family protein [Myxococcota bacterium]|nr:lysophospholipid acyltransferase family protein [Myxococcota bacterium]